VITEVPAETPVSTPEPEPTVATAVVLLLHVPPGTALMSVILPPTHTLMPGVPTVPMIGPGNGFTVTVVVTKQPDDSMYVMTEVPLETPVTMPVDEPTVAIDVLPLLHVPPPVPVKIIVEPTHTLPGPVIAPGLALTVIIPVV